MNESVTLKSGRKLELAIAPFSIGMRLFKTAANELKQVDVQLESLDFQKIAASDVNSIKNVIFQLLGSDALESAVFSCMERCLLDGVKITKSTFEDQDVRADYLPVAWEVIKLNLAPFFKNLDLSSSMPKPAPIASPR